ncbi:hypothetical protein [Cupriavidus metallidurans]|uniref:hypothetical protein n=1 Tax=Cupriavidus metallidurans TaxID=119219 RepID=UPI0016489469|nr:hypothetical protein [Cupriavidus metallidurans]
MIVLLAFLPLQAWAGLGTSAAGVGMAQVHQTADVADVTRATLAVATDASAIVDPGDRGDTPASTTQDSSYPADNAEPSPPGADFAEQLLPAPLPRMATATGRGAVPQYARIALPDPDLPLLPRPPRG